MLRDIFDMFAFYWPKLVAALYFSAMNTYIMTKIMKHKNAVGMFISLFFVSYSFVSIPGGYLATKIFEKAAVVFNLQESALPVRIIWTLLTDYLMVFLGSLAYTKIIGLPVYRSSTVYLQYTCLDHLCLLLALSSTEYFILYLIFQIFFYVLVRRSLLFMLHSDSINWKRLLIHLCGLLFVLDLMYAAYYIFDELEGGVLSFPAIWIDAIALIISALIMSLFSLSIREGKLSYSKIKYMQKFQEGQEHIIQTFAEISEAKSGETGQHVKRVAEYSKLIALKMGVDERSAECLRIAAMMHDVGKLLIPKEIIEKPGKLTPEEFDIVKAHTLYGDQLLSKSDGEIIKMARIIAREHHERWDGTGYPKGLLGNHIDLYAQIVSVADVYDALSSKRAYKDPWTPEDARREILGKRGSQFAPGVVDSFTEVYDGIEAIRLQYRDNL